MADHIKVSEICPYNDRECSGECLAFSVDRENIEIVCQRLENETKIAQALEKISFNTYYR